MVALAKIVLRLISTEGGGFAGSAAKNYRIPQVGTRVPAHPSLF
jgi:hypothetical protein